MLNIQRMVSTHLPHDKVVAKDGHQMTCGMMKLDYVLVI